MNLVVNRILHGGEGGEAGMKLIRQRFRSTAVHRLDGEENDEKLINRGSVRPSTSVCLLHSLRIFLEFLDGILELRYFDVYYLKYIVCRNIGSNISYWNALKLKNFYRSLKSSKSCC